MDRSGRGRMVAGLNPPHAHVLGLDGPGMPGLAQGLVQRGMVVTGSGAGTEATAGRLRDVGVVVRGAADPVSRRTRLLLHGPETGRDHPARLRALRRGVRQETPAGWLRGQSRGRLGVAVVGGRGASAAAAMIGLVLARAGQDPAVFLGAPAPQLGGWARGGDGPHLVTSWGGGPEGLGTIGPRLAVLLDVVGGAGALGPFLRALPAEAHVLALGHPSAWGDEPPGDGKGPGSGRFAWLSLDRGGDWWATDLRDDAGRFRFRAFQRGRYVAEVRLQAPGRRHVANALAAVAACTALGVSASGVKQGVEEFTGLSRDFEVRGSYRGVTLVDDAAEDAASVADAVATARRAFGGRRLWAVYAAGPGGPVPAIPGADRVLVCGRSAPGAVGFVEAVAELDRGLEPGDVLLTLGADDVGTIADAFIRRLPRDRQGG